MNDRWYTTAEVAQRLGMSIEQTLRLVKRGAIEAVWIGGSAGYRIGESALEMFLRDRPARR